MKTTHFVLQYYNHPMQTYKTLAGAKSSKRAELNKSEHKKGSNRDRIYRDGWTISRVEHSETLVG